VLQRIISTAYEAIKNGNSLCGFHEHSGCGAKELRGREKQLPRF